MSVETHHRRVVFETGRYRIAGEVTLPTEGLHNRLSDLLNREGIQFIPLVEATITDLDGGNPESRPFVAVAREHIQLAYEAD